LLRADFNGLFGTVLCLSHHESGQDANGDAVALHSGTFASAFDDDSDDEGRPDRLIASGLVERPPPWLTHTPSRWVLLIDENGVRHQSEITAANEGPRTNDLEGADLEDLAASTDQSPCALSRR